MGEPEAAGRFGYEHGRRWDRPYAGLAHTNGSHPTRNADDDWTPPEKPKVKLGFALPGAEVTPPVEPAPDPERDPWADWDGDQA